MRSLHRNSNSLCVKTVIHRAKQISKIENKLTQLLENVNKHSSIYGKQHVVLYNSYIYEIINHILTKTSKNKNEIMILSLYLRTLNRFIAVVLGSGVDMELLLEGIASKLKHEKHKKGSVLFKNASKVNKMYLVLEGSVLLLEVVEVQVKLSLVYYLKYVVKLIIIEENDLLLNTLSINKHIYNINENEVRSFYETYIEHKNNVTFKFKVHYISSSGLALSSNEINELVEYAGVIKENISKYKSKLLNDSAYNIKDNVVSLLFDYKDFKENETHSQSHKVIVYKYKELSSYVKGDYFGETSLQLTLYSSGGNNISSNSSSKVTAVCLDQCKFSSLTKPVYQFIIKEIQMKTKRTNIKFLLSFSLFSRLNWMFFESHYYNYFTITTVKYNECILEQNKICKDIYFIKEGEFEITTKQTQNELQTLINKFKQPQTNDINDVDDNVRYKKEYKIGICKDKDIIGIDDMVLFDNGISLFKVKCKSERGIMFAIERHILFKIANKIKDINDALKKFSLMRKEMMIKRIEMLLTVKPEEDLYKNYKCENNKSFNKKMLLSELDWNACKGENDIKKRKSSNEKSRHSFFVNKSKMENFYKEHKRFDNKHNNGYVLGESLTCEYNSLLFNNKKSKCNYYNSNAYKRNIRLFSSHLIHSTSHSNLITNKSSLSTYTLLNEHKTRNTPTLHTTISTSNNINNTKSKRVRLMKFKSNSIDLYNNNYNSNNIKGYFTCKQNKHISYNFAISPQMQKHKSNIFIDLLQFEPYGVKNQGRVITSAKIAHKYKKINNLSLTPKKYKIKYIDKPKPLYISLKKI
jgi:CRP-like cAMP-binding protein